ncbi:hypothetical protein [Steroidobacter cummioxidans]|uniref:hypothetical protein n=1 Tax=Steroidobacter cummioxidans TaxID=1803913 RepID=UPI000E31F6A0|nr:hypothetical protein [Steroidobacter cummioxidans]
MKKSAGARRKGVRQKASNPHETSPQKRGKLFTFTIDPATAQVIKFETVDASGASHEISGEETANLAQPGSQKLEQAIEEAFEAGIDCVLGEEDGQNETKESEKDAELRHALLTQLIAHSPAKHLLERESMNRLLLETLIQQAKNTPGRPAASA